MSDGELLDAREAMSLLGINEADLQTMVARGDLRAFRSAGTMKFRRDDVVGIKSEKKTDPTIIMPASAPKAKPGSGILPTVSSAKAPRASSRNLPAVKPGAPKATIPTKGGAPAAPAPAPVADTSTSSDQIILEEFELAPAEGENAANTQQVTASQTAVGGGVTIVDNINDTSNMTVIETGLGDLDTASATASAIAPVAVTATTTSPSGRQKVPSGRTSESSAAAPAMSRVRAAVSSSSQSAAAKRSQASATSRNAGPLITLVLIVTAFVSLMSLSVVSVQLYKGNYDPATGQRVIPPFLAHMPLINYESTYFNLPGHPADSEGERKRPSDEIGGK